VPQGLDGFPTQFTHLKRRSQIPPPLRHKDGANHRKPILYMKRQKIGAAAKSAVSTAQHPVSTFEAVANVAAGALCE
jgi:hypothetical protein